MPGAEVFDAVIIGALKAIKAAIEKVGSDPTKLLIDNKAVVDVLLKGRSNSSQSLTDIFIGKYHGH